MQCKKKITYLLILTNENSDDLTKTLSKWHLVSRSKWYQYQFVLSFLGGCIFVKLQFLKSDISFVRRLTDRHTEKKSHTVSFRKDAGAGSFSTLHSKKNETLAANWLAPTLFPYAVKKGWNPGCYHTGCSRPSPMLQKGMKPWLLSGWLLPPRAPDSAKRNETLAGIWLVGKCSAWTGIFFGRHINSLLI
jgi:hypothetical protein